MKHTLEGYWPLDEDSGDALDYSGNENHGTVNGATQGVAGPLGASAYDFDGTDDRVELPDFGFGSSTPFTFAGWINLDDASASNSSFVARYDGSDDVMQIFWSTSVWKFQVGHAGGGNSISADGGSGSDNTWTHICGTYDPSGPTVKLYQNGSIVATATGTVDDFTTTDGPWVGARNDNNNHHDGQIDDVRIYSRALSPSEVAYLYEVGQQARFRTDTRTL